MALTVACVKVGKKYDDSYVRKLRDGVKRHLRQDHEFVCLSDTLVEGVKCLPAPDWLPGWWAKIALFNPDLFPKGCLYFDLDVVVTGDLTPMVEWQGFGILQDWWRPTFNSSVMKLTGEEGHVWNLFQPQYMRMVEGDQDFITGVMSNARTFPRKWFPSYKADKCFDAPPPDAMAVIFHGLPKPHQCDGWVRAKWTEEGETDA